MTPRPRTVRWLVVGLLAAAILLASVAPVPPGAGPAGIDKALHALSFAVLSAALAFALADGSRSSRGVAAAAVALAVAYGLGIEGIQFALPHRTFDLADLAADAVGAVAGVIARWVAGR